MFFASLIALPVAIALCDYVMDEIILASHPVGYLRVLRNEGQFFQAGSWATVRYHYNYNTYSWRIDYLCNVRPN